MTIRVRAICRATLSSVTPELLSAAIAGRLEPVTAQHRPSDEEPPRQVLARLRIEAEDAEPFGVWRLYWSSDTRRFLRLERQVGRSFEQERRDLFDETSGREEPGADRVRALLSTAKESACFELEASDASSMAWPLAIAAAAALAKAGDGFLRVDDHGWLEPSGKEVASVLSEPK